ncbi:unnamed protein product, partial [Coregonus sp. 'balchen']
PNSEFIGIPYFLEKYLVNRLPVFVENSLKTIMMTQRREYMIVQAMEGARDKNLYHTIIPGDFQASKADNDFLARHYETDSCTIPAHRHKKIVKLPAIQVNGQAQRMEILCETAWRVADSGQVVLVVCEDVKVANELENKMERGTPHPHVTLYTIREKHNIESTKFRGGQIIISTNLGGCGTDIKLDQDVNLPGGIFVLLTHYPGCRRVEKQMFGQTVRKGNPGMVQMILRGDNLAPAYQGQPVEVMRQLREDYEVQHIKDMETDELLEIKRKEYLFGTFCEFLDNFDSNFTKQEKQDRSRMAANDVPQCYKNRGTKFDYQPALNALKETWALWLTLHEEPISRHDDISVLKADLLEHMTNNMLLNEKSPNFYNHIKQAIGRTDLHCRNKSKCDYGAKSYWKDVEECDPFYQDVITINMAKDGYKTEAHGLLERAKTTVGVYLSETTNTMVSFQTGERGNFEPHHEEEQNFLKQIDSRMSIYKAWIQNISLAVKNKPEFSFDALICFFIGMCQNGSNFKIDSKLEQQIKDLVQDMTKYQISGLVTDSTTSQVSDLIGRLSEVSNKATELVAKSGTQEIAKVIKISFKIAEHTTNLVQLVQSIPTEHVINDIFVLQLINEIEEQQHVLGKYDQDGRHNLPDVIRLNDEYLSSISDSVSQAFIDVCAGHMSFFVKGLFKKKVNGITGKVVGSILGRHKTEAFFQDRQHKYDMKSASQKTGKVLSENETK